MLKPENDFDTWAVVLTSSIEPGGDYILLLDDVLRLLENLVNKEVIGDELQENTSLFAQEIFPTVLRNILNLEYVEKGEYQKILKFFRSVISHLIDDLLNDQNRFAEILMLIYNKECSLFKHNNHCSRYFPSTESSLTHLSLVSLIRDFYKKIVERICRNDFDIYGFQLPICLGLLFNNEIMWESCEMDYLRSSLSSIVFRYIDGFSKDKFRSFETQSVSSIMRIFVSLFSLSSDYTDQVLEKIFGFSLLCLKSEILKFQILGIELLITKSKEFYISFDKWLYKMDLINFFVANDFHQSIYEKLPFFFDSIQLSSNEYRKILLQLFPKYFHCPLHVKPYIMQAFISIYSKLEGEDESLVFQSIIESIPEISQIFDFVSELAIQIQEIKQDSSNSLLNYVIEGLNNELYSKEAKAAIEKVISNNNISKNNTFFIIDKLVNMYRHNSSNISFCQLLTLLIVNSRLFLTNNQSLSIDSFFELFGHNVDEELVPLFYAFFERQTVILTSLQCLCLFYSLSKSSLGWKCLKKLIKVKHESLFSKEGIYTIWKELESHDISPLSTEFVSFLYYLILATAIKDNYYFSITSFQNSHHKHRIRGKICKTYQLSTLSITGVPLLIKILSQCRDNDVFNNGKDLFFMLIQSYHEASANQIALYLQNIYVLYGDSSFYSRARVLQLIYLFTIDVYEIFFDVNDFGFIRHKPNSKKGKVHINVHYNNSTYVFFANPKITLDGFYKMISHRILIEKSGFRVKTEENQVLDSYTSTLEELGVYPECCLYIEVFCYDMLPENSMEALLSFNLSKNGFAKLLLNDLDGNSFLPIDNDNQIFIKQAWSMLQVLATDSFFTNNSSSVESIYSTIKKTMSPYIIAYILESCLNQTHDKSKEMHSTELECLLINLLLKNELPTFCMKTIVHFLCIMKLQDYSLLRIAELFPFIIEQCLSRKSCKLYNYFLIFISHLILINPQKISVIAYQNVGSLYLLFEKCPLKYLSQVITTLNNLTPKFEIYEVFYSHKDIYFFENIRGDHYFLLMSKLIDETVDPVPFMELCINELRKKHQKRLNGPLLFIKYSIEKYPSLIHYALSAVFMIIPSIFEDYNESFFHFSIELLISIYKSFNEYKKTIVDFLNQYLLKPIEYDENLHSNQKSSSGLSGLKNLGATCYINSIIQQLVSCDEFYASIIGITQGENWVLELRDIILRIRISRVPVIDTSSLCSILPFNNETKINVKEQQDANEFLQFIIDNMSQAIKNLYQCTIINKITGIDEYLDTEGLDLMYSICTPVKGFHNLYDSLSSIFSEESLIGNNMYFSSTLDRKINAKRKPFIRSLGDFVIFQLNRFEYDTNTWTKKKIDDYFEFPYDLDLTPFMEKSGALEFFSFVGSVVHIGSAEGGHYFSIIRVKDNWYLFNDETIEEIDYDSINTYMFGDSESLQFSQNEETSNPSAYLLFYKRCNPIFNGASIIESQKNINLLTLDSISKENSAYFTNQTLVSSSFFAISMTIEDISFFMNYLINVFVHTNFVNDITRVEQRFLYLFEKDSNAEICGKTISLNSDSIVTTLLKGNIPEMNRFLVRIIQKSISSCNTDSILPFFDYLIHSLKGSSAFWKNIPNIGLLIYSFVSQNPLNASIGQDQKYCDQIVSYIQEIYQTKSQALIQNIDLSIMFEVLQLIGYSSIDSLIPLGYLLIQSSNHGKSFMQWCFSVDIHMFLDELSKRIKEMRMPNRDVFLINGILSSSNEEHIHTIINFAQEKLSLTDDHIVSLLQEKIRNGDFMLSKKMIFYPDVILFRYLLSHDPICKNSEKIVYSLFSSRYEGRMPFSSESYFSKSNHNYSFYSYYSPRHDFPNTTTPLSEDDQDMFQSFSNRIVQFISRIPVEQCINEPTRFSSIFRVLIWLNHYSLYNENALSNIIEFVNRLDQISQCANSCLIDLLYLLDNHHQSNTSNFVNNKFDIVFNLVFRPQLSGHIAYDIDKTLLFLQLFHEDLLINQTHFQKLFNSEKFKSLTGLMISHKDDAHMNAFIRVTKDLFIEKSMISIYILEKLRELLYTEGEFSLSVGYLSSIISNHLTDDDYIKIVSKLLENIEICHQIQDYEHQTDIDRTAELLSSVIIDCNHLHTSPPQEYFITRIPVFIDYLTNRGDICIRNGVRSVLIYFSHIYEDLGLSLMNYIAENDYHDESFWITHSIFCEILSELEESQLKSEYIMCQFPKMLDNLENQCISDLDDSFAFMAQIIHKEGFEQHELWASVLFTQIMEWSVFRQGTKEFLISVMKHIDEETLFTQCLDIINALEEEIDSITFNKLSNRLEIYFIARPDIKEKVKIPEKILKQVLRCFDGGF